MRRIMIFAAMALIVMSAAAQGVVRRQVIDLKSVKIEEAKAMRPDTVMPNGDWQKVVQTEMSAKDGFKYARQVLAKLVPDYQNNVQLEDTTDCKLVVTGALPLLASAKIGDYTSLLEGMYDITLTILIKDSRYRISCESVKCLLGNSSPAAQVIMPMADLISKTGSSLQKNLRIEAGRLVAMIDRMLKKQKSDNDF